MLFETECFHYFSFSKVALKPLEKFFILRQKFVQFLEWEFTTLTICERISNKILNYLFLFEIFSHLLSAKFL